MTTPPNDRPDPADPWARPTDEPVSFDKPQQHDPEPQNFDPYRYGAPEHPVPPEYAPPGYRPPPSQLAQQQGQPAQGYHQPYGGGPGYPYPLPYAHQYPQPKTGNGKAVAALVLGIVSVLLFWTSVIDIVPVVLAIVFGALGISESRRAGGGRAMAMTGLILGIVGALLATVMTVIIYQRIRPCLDYSRNSSAYNSCIHDRF